ncbi:MAG: type IV pilus assembly protein PilM [Pirellulales bacterium]|nr:type IV pilus assembly protein PilM [Pirellulales bacterium]
MAKSNAIWGIDIGQCALKALQCRPHDKDPKRIIAESFDYIEYSKILSQPEADRTELVAEALAQFVSRNDLSGDRVAISVPGQTGLARFIKLPPVESKKIPDIVKYEARQQIPFSLEDVVWDYQQLAGGSEEEGYVLETEVGLFAMKRDQVSRSLKPLNDAGIDIDVIQLAPLAIYNFLCFDLLDDLHSGAPYDPQNPPPSTVVISLGTDTTDLVVTNGYRVWQRNIPIGGNHFTKALSKELRLTFSKAEHLKRHATQADDPKAVFQAMRPVFSDLLAEIQRSIGYFTSIDKTASIGQIVALGNAMKLPGLQRYLSQNLEQTVVPIKEYQNLVGGSVTAGPQFKENILSFAVSYGLCVQGLGLSELRTNLLPEEIITHRLIRAKKPWMVAGIAALLVGCTVNYIATFASLKSVDVEKPLYKTALASADTTQRKSTDLMSQFKAAQDQFIQIQDIGDNLVSNVEGRLRWLELLKAISTALPKEEAELDDSQNVSMEELAKAISEREVLHIQRLDCQYLEDVSTWFAGVAEEYRVDSAKNTEEGKASSEATQPADGAASPDGAAPADDGTGNPAGDATASAQANPTEDPNAAADTNPPDTSGSGFADDASAQGGGTTEGPTGPGWIIELRGFHYHNADIDNEGAEFIRNTFLKNLTEGSVELPPPPGDPTQPAPQEGEGETELIPVPMKDLSISYPVIVWYSEIRDQSVSMGGDEEALAGAVGREVNPRQGRQPGSNQQNNALPEPKILKLRRINFIIQFCWQPKTPTERLNPEKATNAAIPDDSSDGTTDY